MSSGENQEWKMIALVFDSIVFEVLMWHPGGAVAQAGGITSMALKR